jgi:diguanylate cyclase (GGDEF)-like protein/putative nucleotidyltransferase with HDIG domain
MVNDPSQAQYLLVSLGLRTLLGLLLLYIYRRKRQPYVLYWAIAWLLLSLGSLAHFFSVTQSRAPALLPHLDSLLLAFATLLFLDSARVYAGGGVNPGVTVYLAPFFLAWLVLRAAMGGPLQGLPLEWGSAAALAVTGVMVQRDTRRREVMGGTLLASSFFLWALATALSLPAGWVEPLLGSLTPVLLNLPWQLTAFSLLVVLYEDEKRSLERHMLSMAGLNLISSTAQRAATVQEMAEQTLERLLASVRMPAGVVALRLDGDGDDALHCVHRGQSGFLRAVEGAGLIPYLRHTVSRLAGLLVFTDLSGPTVPAAFARESQFQELARLARAEGVRLILGVSLRVKDADRGVLLLASSQFRRFTPAEIRLLLGLGGQLGLAVDNYHLMQQTARRSEELRLLNEIGQTLSSVRNVDELLERMHAEMGKVIDVSNFYIALYQPGSQEVCFELEIKEGSFQPKRRRQAGNGLTEYVLKRREPLLIQKDFARRVGDLGVKPGREARSFCAAPILLHGQPVGVIAVINYDRENAFDQGHVNILSTLAGQAAVAIENARLFAGEQKRVRQLGLLNNVARQAIATLNPDEILAAMASEIYAGLSHDYVGLGVLDYASREVVIQAEGVQGARGLHRRFKLGEGSVGRVAMSGKVLHIENLAEAGKLLEYQPVLPDAHSMITLPLLYAEQLLGVLHFESRQPNAFSKDALLLRTLADQVGGALHNAFIFQRAQEQAITDGMTGVKTHRYFMEALTTEWRRATRGSRSFSLMLLDLDKFKFVNDYFGHLEGDAVLQRVGRILEQNVRRSDVVARYGGDEFVVLMPETNAGQAYSLGDKLRHWLANDPLLREKKMTASVGLATYPQHAPTPQELIQIADASMYLAKHQGGNNIVSADHYKKSEQKQWQRHVLEAYLGVAIKRLFSTGSEAFEQIYRRLEQVAESLGPPGEWREVPAPVLETVTSLAFAIDAKNHYTQGHSENVARYCLQAGRHLNLAQEEMEELRLAAILHDIGKIGIPERLLSKAAALDPDEFETMKQHSGLGARILEPLQCMESIQKIIRHHHERWDGSGYPDGLAGEKTPLASRLIAIADAYDTIVTERTYKRASSRQEAFEELRRCAGTQFDPDLVKAFLETAEAQAEAGQTPPVARA